MARDTSRFLQNWHRIVRERDIDAISSMLADDVSIGAPPYWDRLDGKPLVNHLLGLVLQTIEEFTYHREWVDGAELALEFTGHVDGTRLQGIDLITVDDNNRVARLDVLMRPVNGVIMLRERISPKMAAFLETLS